MSDENWFVLRAQKAEAYGRPHGDGFFVQKGSTAMREGSPLVKRDRDERDRLVALKVLEPDSNPLLYRFSRDHVFGSSSAAGGIIKDGNCSGPQSWFRLSDGKTLKASIG